MESDGEYVTTGVLAKSFNSSNPIKLSLYFYVNGNDKNCTNNNIYVFGKNSSEFTFKFKVSKNQ